MNKKYGAFSSSENHEELAASIKAIILAIASALILLASSFGISIAQADMVEIATQLSLAVSSIWFLWGVIRKAIIYFAK